MLNILGAKRVFGLLIMVLLVGGLAAAHYLFLVPEGEKTQRTLNAIKSEVSGRRDETERLRTEFQQLGEVKARYEQLSRFGFMNEQDRVFARGKMAELQKESGVIAARYEISPVEELKNERLEAAGYVLIKSQIKMEVDAFDDTDVFRFIHLLSSGFPGQATIKTIEIKRELDVTVPVLQGIGTGNSTPLVKAKIDVEWYSVRKKPATAGGGQL